MKIILETGLSRIVNRIAQKMVRGIVYVSDRFMVAVNILSLIAIAIKVSVPIILRLLLLSKFLLQRSNSVAYIV